MPKCMVQLAHEVKYQAAHAGLRTLGMVKWMKHFRGKSMTWKRMPTVVEGHARRSSSSSSWG